MDQQWSSRIIVNVAIFACGLAIGAVGTGIAFSPLDAIDTIGKTQNILAAGVAFVAAVVAYKAQIAKVSSDERARVESQTAKIDAILDEIVARNRGLLTMVRTYHGSMDGASLEHFRQLCEAGTASLKPMISRAEGRLPELWKGLDATPKNLRRNTHEILIAHEEIVELIEDHARVMKDLGMHTSDVAAQTAIHNILARKIESMALVIERGKVFLVPGG